MRLLAIEQTRSPQGKLRLRFDSGEAMLVLPAVVADLSLCPGMDIPDAARASLEAAAGSASAKERAVRILSAATVSRAELEHRLRQKGESPENARQAVEWLDGLSLLDDEAAARQIVRSGTAKGYGAARIRQELTRRGIDRDTAEAAMQTFSPDEAQMLALLEKRLRGDVSDRKEVEKAVAALQRRGFAWNDIKRALETYGSSLPEEE
jgi:regulatory protein